MRGRLLASAQTRKHGWAKKKSAGKEAGLSARAEKEIISLFFLFLF
jgi:hypothetical protein